MKRLTLDTTVLAKGMFPPRRRKEDNLYEKNLRLHNSARSIIMEIENRQAMMNIPSVAIVEIAAVGARITGKEEIGIHSSDYVREYGSIFYDIHLLDEAIKIAAKTKVSGFDSIFVACAKITNSILITDDKGMYDAAIQIGVEAKLLRDME